MERLYDWGKGWITHSGETEATRKRIPGVEDFLRRFLASTPKEESVIECPWRGMDYINIRFATEELARAQFGDRIVYDPEEE
jgi:hypothetical protein